MASVLILNATLPPSAVITARGCLASVTLFCTQLASHMSPGAARATGASGQEPRPGAGVRHVPQAAGAGHGELLEAPTGAACKVNRENRAPCQSNFTGHTFQARQIRRFRAHGSSSFIILS